MLKFPKPAHSGGLCCFPRYAPCGQSKGGDFSDKEMDDKKIGLGIKIDYDSLQPLQKSKWEPTFHNIFLPNIFLSKSTKRPPEYFTDSSWSLWAF